MDIAPRPLSGAESDVIGLLLSRDFTGVDELRRQVVGARVVGRCDCGCPTINLQVDDTAPSAPIVGPLAPVELRVAPTGDEPPGEVLLFVDAGRITSLEYVFYDDAPPDSWPALDRMTIFER